MMRRTLRVAETLLTDPFDVLALGYIGLERARQYVRVTDAFDANPADQYWLINELHAREQTAIENAITYRPAVLFPRDVEKKLSEWRGRFVRSSMPPAAIGELYWRSAFTLISGMKCSLLPCEIAKHESGRTALELLACVSAAEQLRRSTIAANDAPRHVKELLVFWGVDASPKPLPTESPAVQNPSFETNLFLTY